MASTVKVTRWSRSEAPAEADLRGSMLAQGLQPYGWSNRAGDAYTAHSHAYDKVIYVVAGGITFYLPETGEQRTLNPGDRLDLDVLVTPPDGHLAQARQIFAAGLPLLAEKPLTLTIDEGKILVKTVRQLNKVFQTSTEDRAVPEYHRMAELVRNGRIVPTRRRN